MAVLYFCESYHMSTLQLVSVYFLKSFFVLRIKLKYLLITRVTWF